jgi:hypothetical protein
LVHIALTLKFSCQANFTRAFREVTGRTPAQFLCSVGMIAAEPAATIHPEADIAHLRSHVSFVLPTTAIKQECFYLTIARLLTDQSKSTSSHPWQDRGNLIVMGP